jgi:hypothetical protein
MRKARYEHMRSGLAQRSDLTADMLNWQPTGQQVTFERKEAAN